MKPIVQMLSPEPASGPKRFAWLDGVSTIVSSAAKSGLIAMILAGIETVDVSKLTPWQAFAVGFVVLACSTATRLYRTGPTDDDAPTPTPDGPAPRPDSSVSARKAA